MKKFISLALCMTLGAALLTGCSSNLPTGYSPFQQSGEPTPAVIPVATPSAVPETIPLGVLKTGLAVINSAEKSKEPAGSDAGLAQMDTTVVAVLVDEMGKIVACKMDGVQTKINFDATGNILTPLDTEVRSKNELGTEYGMGNFSSIGKEWSEQAAALSQYVVGKTVDEVKGIAVDETTKPTDAELSTSVTVSIGGYVAAIEKAVEGAQNLGAQAGDKLGLGIATNIAKSKNAASDGDGLAQAYSMYTAATFDGDGKITSCILDGSQTDVTFDADGTITSSLTDGFQTKNERKDAYGMKKVSSIGKEWYEQAAAFAHYVLGKTAAEVSGIAVDDSTHTTEADLATSVTVAIGDFQAIIEKAEQTAI